MSIKVTIRRNADNAIAVGVHNYEYCPYQWTVGNFSCDCNRSLFFAEFLDPDADEYEEAECGDYGYSVKIEDPETQEVLLDELSDRGAGFAGAGAEYLERYFEEGCIPEVTP